MNLRWIERDGKMVLQHNHHPNYTDWYDVPTHQEPKKVTVEDELTVAMLAVDNQYRKLGGCAPMLQLSIAAIEFFKKRISGLPATQALRQCEQALFGEA